MRIPTKAQIHSCESEISRFYLRRKNKTPNLLKKKIKIILFWIWKVRAKCHSLPLCTGSSHYPSAVRFQTLQDAPGHLLGPERFSSTGRRSSWNTASPARSSGHPERRTAACATTVWVSACLPVCHSLSSVLKLLAVLLDSSFKLNMKSDFLMIFLPQSASTITVRGWGTVSGGGIIAFSTCSSSPCPSSLSSSLPSSSHTSSSVSNGTAPAHLFLCGLYIEHSSVS